MAETLSTFSIISFVVAGVGLVLAIFFWFFFKIPTVIGDLSGRTARKSIAKMRAENERSGKPKERKGNTARGKMTGTMSDLDKTRKASTLDPKMETEVLAENRAEGTDSGATEVLREEATAMLGAEETGILQYGQTTAPLTPDAKPQSQASGGVKLTMCDEVMLTHTDEVIA